MKRWLRQHDHFSCGPIALINLDKWRGKSVTNHDLSKYRRCCHCCQPRGTKIINLSRAVGKSPQYRFNYHCFKRHLLRGGAAIINIQWPHGGHYFFVLGVTKYNDRRRFLVVNFTAGETLTLLSWQYMVALLRQGCTWTFRPC